ncbi:MAG: AAA family ATPase, partial [Clostridium sp.]|nr:AAA family ATPase [Clostridium sp.]
MKLFKKMLLIHWHYFSHQVIELGDLNFLTGKNASGKSTIIDALQLLLLGDTSGSFFNKAANGRGNRTLKGYLLGELGDDEASGFHYLRANRRFSSYVAVEVYDDIKKTSFSAGCCFDIYSENDWKNNKFFLFDGAFPTHEFVLDKKPMSIDQLRKFLKESYPNGHYEMPESGKRFRELFYGKLGGLRTERFPSLLKKAVSFNPNDDIEQFISEFVCDKQQEVDITPMQENIRSYKQLEAEAGNLAKRIELLGEIVRTHGLWKKHADDEMLYHYLVERSSLEMSREDLLDAKNKLDTLSAQLTQLQLDLMYAKTKLDATRDEKSAFELKRAQNDQALSLKEMEYQIAEVKKQIHVIQSEFEIVVASLRLFLTTWAKGADFMVRTLEDQSVLPDDAVLESLLSDTKSLALDLSKTLLNFQANHAHAHMVDVQHMEASTLQKLKPSEADKPSRNNIDTPINHGNLSTLFNRNNDTRIDQTSLSKIYDKTSALKNHAIVLSSNLQDKQKELSKRKAELEDEKKSLESGIYKFPPYVIELRKAIRSRLRVLAKREIDVFILAEIAEIDGDRWRGVIEGYIANQKYYL